jgi:hypothetical protein
MEEKEILKKIREEKTLVRAVCLGLVHPDQTDQKKFTEWLQNTVIFHLDNLKRKIKHG